MLRLKGASDVRVAGSGAGILPRQPNLLRAFWAAVEAARDQATKLPREEAEAKGIPDGLRFHDLRHSSASLLLSQGQSPRAVSQRLGHTKPALTLKVYAHGLPSDDAQSAAGLARTLA